MNEENKISLKEELNEFLLYTSPNGEVKVEVFFHDETIWASQDKIAQLFGSSKQNVSQHLKNIFEDCELDENVVVNKFFTTASDGKKYKVKYYNLDAIIAVGYRVNSSKATQFRIWATDKLKEYIIKGFVMDDDRMKNGKFFGRDYFQELLERVRSIRASERRIYLQITDIFQECSVDYDKNSQVTRDFFASVQNKFHYAITGKTAVEIINDEADKNKPNMGLHTWKNAPAGRIIKSDVVVAKNYLKEEEIKKLERTISGFFDYIENVIENRNTFTMKEFAESVGKFLEFNEYKVLDGKGRISSRKATEKAVLEYNEFNKTQKIENDFEKQILKSIKGKS